MKTSFKTIIITLAVLVVLGIAALVYALSQRGQQPSESSADTVASTSHVLDDAGPDAVTLVEFLDFECEACGAFHPIVEDIRETYDGEITYVVRYFPLPGHKNSVQSALAAEAAAQQGRFEDMYNRLFETQAQWGEQPQETPEVFRAFAEDLGLDMAEYDAAIADPATLARIQQDRTEGAALGVQSTPSFFLDGELLELTAWGDLEAAVEKAVNG